MTEEEFNKQLNRLKSQWSNSYGPERVARMWKGLKGLSEAFFAEIVDEALDTCRSAPLMEDFGKLEIEVGKRRAQGRIYDSFSRAGSPADALEEAARNNKTADPEFVKACMRLMKDKEDGRISSEQFFQMCDELDRLADQLNPQGRRRPSPEAPPPKYTPYRDD